jgi:hypothetical protein
MLLRISEFTRDVVHAYESFSFAKAWALRFRNVVVCIIVCEGWSGGAKRECADGSSLVSPVFGHGKGSLVCGCC